MSSATAYSSSEYAPVLQPTKECDIHQDAVIGIRKAYLRMRFGDHVPEACHLRFVPAGLKTEIGRIDESLAHTACWTYIGDRKDGGDPYHLICIGEKCLKPIKTDSTNPGIQLGYLTNLLEHEVGHLRHTERDFALIQKLAEAEKLSMGAINIGEDCRIEALITKEREHLFAWDTYRNPPDPESLSNPPNAMITARHFTGDRSLVLAHLSKAGLTEAHADCVVSYYQQLVGAPNTAAVVSIMRKFCDDFRKIDTPPEDQGAGANSEAAPPNPSSTPGSSSNEPNAGGSGAGSQGGDSSEEKPSHGSGNGTSAGDKSSAGADGDGEQSKDGKSGGEGTPKQPGEPVKATPTSCGDGSSSAGQADSTGKQASAGGSSAPTSGDSSGPKQPSGSSSEGTAAPEASPQAVSGKSTANPATPNTAAEATPERTPRKEVRPEQVIGEDPNDMELSEKIAQQGDLLETIMKRCFDPTAVAVAEKPNRENDQNFGLGLHTEVEYSAGGIVLGSQAWGAIDRRRVDRSVAMLLQAMRGRQEIVTTDRPTRRLDNRLAILGSDRPYKQRVEAEHGSGPLKVVLIMDCSGSMSSGCLDNGATPISEGRHFVAVMNELAKRRRVEGILALSKVKDGTAWCQAIRLPMPDKDILRITADGDGEGLAMALERLSPAIRDADMTGLYTDGRITDIAIDKKKFHRKGVHLYGLYVGPDSHSQNLRKHTDYPMTASSLEALTGRYARTLLNHRARRRVGG